MSRETEPEPPPRLSPSSAPIRPRQRAGRLVLFGMAAVLATLVAVVWILPGLLDWNRYRASIAGLVAAGIGRPVQIDGDITLHLLPQPFLTATDLKVDDAGDGVVMQVDAVRLRVALGPLMAGRVDARELTLQRADLRLPWPPPAGALSRRPPAWITGLQARVEDSRLQVGDLVLSDVDAALGADPETGTLSAAGSATLFALPTRFTIRLGRPGRDGAAPLDLSLDGQDKLRDTGGTVSGAIEADGSLTGRVTARGNDLSQLIPAPATAWRADGRISAAGGVLVADELALEIGGSPARGAVALRVQPSLRLDLALAASRLDLDSWTPVLLRSLQPGAPNRIPTGIDLSAESATLAGGTLRQLRLALDLDADDVALREAAALLPGEAKVTGTGHFPRKGKAAGFDGSFTAIAPDLRATLAWLEPVAPAVVRAVPPGALRTANIAARLAVDPAQVSLTDLKGTLDGAPIGGGLVVRLGARPAVSFGLTLDRLSLDPFTPDRAVLDHPAAAYAAAIKSLAGAGFDSDLKLQLRQADWRGTRFGPVAFDVQSEAGRLTLRRLEVALAPFHLMASGTLGDGGRVAEGRVELTAPDLAPLRPFLPTDKPWLAGLASGPGTLLLTASGPPDALALRATAELGDLRAEWQPVLNVPGHRWSGPVAVQHPGAPRLLNRLGIGDAAAWLGDGSFSLIAQLAKAPGRLDLSNLELVAGLMRATGQLSFAGDTAGGRIKAETLTLPAVDPRSTEPLPFGALAGGTASLHVEAERVTVGQVPTVTGLAFDASLQKGTVAVENLSAKLGDAAITAAARLEPGDLPHLTLGAKAAGIAVDHPLLGGTLDIASGTLDAALAVTGEGFSPAALTATLTGSSKLSVRDAGVTGFDLPAATAALAQPDGAKLLAALRPTLLSGRSSFTAIDIPFDISRGVATVHATGSAPPGAATLAGTVDLLGRTVEGRLTLAPGPGLPDLPVRLSGAVTDPVRTPELAGAARWLADRP